MGPLPRDIRGVCAPIIDFDSVAFDEDNQNIASLLGEDKV